MFTYMYVRNGCCATVNKKYNPLCIKTTGRCKYMTSCKIQVLYEVVILGRTYCVVVLCSATRTQNIHFWFILILTNLMH